MTPLKMSLFVAVTASSLATLARGQQNPNPHAGHAGHDAGMSATTKAPPTPVEGGDKVGGEKAKDGSVQTASYDPLQGDFSKLLPAKSPEVIELKEGDSYDLRASVVKQTVGGKTFRRFAYNGSIPGPLFKVKQGATAKIRFINETDVDTSLHSHGLRQDYRFDGAVGISQPAVKPGETFVYELKFPDAGIFWYHPHVREDYQQDMGLMGNFLVEPKGGAFWSAVDREEVVMLDDMLAVTPVPYPVDGANHAIMGRFGDTFLVNGAVLPSLSYRPGEIVRYFVTNAANTRTFRLGFRGAKMKLVGSDLSPFEKEAMADSVTIAPGERYVIEVKFPGTGRVEFVNHTPQSMATLATFEPKGDMVTRVTPLKFETLRSNISLKKEIDAFTVRAKGAKSRTLKLSVSLGGEAMSHAGHGMPSSADPHAGHVMPSSVDPHAGHTMNKTHAQKKESKDVPWIPAPSKIEWEDTMREMNEKSTTATVKWKMIDSSGKVNMGVNWILAKGEIARILLDNSKGGDHPMQHPIHFHGQRFVVASVNGKKTKNRAWKDTVLVGTGDKVEILLDASNPGKWMAHCHISEHLTSGMMTGFEVN